MRLDRGEEEKSFRKKRFKDIVEAVEFSFLCDEKVESRNVDISRIGEDKKKTISEISNKERKFDKKKREETLSLVRSDDMQTLSLYFRYSFL